MTTPNHPGDDHSSLTDRELLEHLAETDLRLKSLQDEIRRRMHQHAKTASGVEQHAEISRMVEHLEQATIDWHKVREFFLESIVGAHNPWAETKSQNPPGH